jgi:anti-sigma B factor antagonist
MSESRGKAGEVCLALAGELDLAECAWLEARLAQAARAGASVRLDLSGLDFIDSSGLHVLIDACHAARRGGWRLEIDPALRQPVRRTIEIVSLDGVLWPTGSVPARPGR